MHDLAVVFNLDPGQITGLRPLKLAAGKRAEFRRAVDDDFIPQKALASGLQYATGIEATRADTAVEHRRRHDVRQRMVRGLTRDRIPRVCPDAYEMVVGASSANTRTC